MLKFFDILLGILVKFNIISECLIYLGELVLRCPADRSFPVVGYSKDRRGHLREQAHPVRARHLTASQNGCRVGSAPPTRAASVWVALREAE